MASPAGAGTRSAFVTVAAKVSIAIGALATLYALLQLCAALLVLGQEEAGHALAFLTAQPIPAPARWIVTHLTTIAIGFLLVCVAFVTVSVGLLQRRAWGWWGFVAFMVLGAAANFAGIAAIDALFAWVQALPHNPEAAQLKAELGALRTLSLAMLWVTAIVFAVLHALVVWQLCRPGVRTEFGMARPPR